MFRLAPLYLALAAVCGFGLFATTAFAAAAAPCTSYAGLADLDKDGFCAFVGSSTSATTGWKGSIDCDDADKTVFPGGLPEGAGSDNYCDVDGSIKSLPVSVAEFDRFMRGEYSKLSRPSFAGFVREYDLCKDGAAATPKTCEIVVASGDFKVSDGYVLEDVFVNGTRVWRNHDEDPDGREIVGTSDWSLWHKKNGGSSSTSSTYTGPSKKQRDDDAIAATKPKIDEAVGAEREERKAADTEHERRIGAIEAGDVGRDDVLNRHGDALRTQEQRLADQDTALREEKRQREIADGQNAAAAEEALGRANAAMGAAHDAQDEAFAAQSHGPLFEVGGVGGAIMRQDLPFLDTNGRPTGEFAREAAIGGGGIELRVGADLAGVQGAVFGQVFLGSDGVGTGAGSGPDMGVLVGADLLAETSSVEVGGWLGYLHTEDHSLDIERGTDYLEITVREDGVIGGVLFQGDLTGEGAGRVVPFLRLGVGVGNYHGRRQSLGAINVTNRVGPLALLQGGFRFGAGALRR